MPVPLAPGSRMAAPPLLLLLPGREKPLLQAQEQNSRRAGIHRLVQAHFHTHFECSLLLDAVHTMPTAAQHLGAMVSLNIMAHCSQGQLQVLPACLQELTHLC